MEQLVQWWLEGYQELAISHGLTSDVLEEGLADLGYDNQTIVREVQRLEASLD